MDCTILSLDTSREFSSVASVTVPGLTGEMEVLPHHAELFATLTNGSVCVRMITGASQTIEIPESIIHVDGDHVMILS